jgi:Putative zinc-finger
MSGPRSDRGSCPFAHDDAAYVLGALSPADRLEFERHLPGCAECTRAVGELAGLPGLLGRVDASVLEDPAPDPPLPATLLPALSREVGRTSRRRTAVVAALAAAAVTVLALGVGAAVTRDGDGALPAAGSTSVSPSAEQLPMTPVGDVPVTATVALQGVTWGTRLELTCSYDTEKVEYDLPPEVDYALVVRTRDGQTEQVGTWRSEDGTTMHITGATATDRADIASVEVRTPDGQVVLRADA